MATKKCMLSVVMNSGVIYRIVFEDIEVATERKKEWISSEVMFDITYSDGSTITVNKNFVESINLTPVNQTHISSSLDKLFEELQEEQLRQMRINDVNPKLRDIQYSIDRLKK